MKSRNNLVGFAGFLALAICVPAAKAGVDPKLECVKLKTALTLEWQNQERLNQLHKQVISIIVDEYKGLIPVKWKTEKHKRLNDSYLEAHNSQGSLESNSLKQKVNVLKMTGVNAVLAEEYGRRLSPEGINRLYAKSKNRDLLLKENDEAENQLAVLQITPSSAPTKLEIFCREYGVYWR